MKSMTGYGRGECARDGFKVTVEVSSVNRKTTELSFNLPRAFEVLEGPLRDLLNRRIARGRVSVRVTLHESDGIAYARSHLNLPLAKAYAQQLARLARELKLASTVTLDHLVRAPGVFETDEGVVDAERFWPPLAKATNTALEGMLRMREREGTHLAKDLAGRVAVMQRAVAAVAKRAPQASQRYREQLRERIRAAGVELPGNDDRLLKEVALFADRCDISEELSRLQSHFAQFADCLKATEPVGRTLDFLAQEMNREINTLGSKANDPVISREVVKLKTELEKYREQVQNVE